MNKSNPILSNFSTPLLFEGLFGGFKLENELDFPKLSDDTGCVALLAGDNAHCVVPNFDPVNELALLITFFRLNLFIFEVLISAETGFRILESDVHLRGCFIRISLMYFDETSTPNFLELAAKLGDPIFAAEPESLISDPESTESAKLSKLRRADEF